MWYNVFVDIFRGVLPFRGEKDILCRITEKMNKVKEPPKMEKKKRFSLLKFLIIIICFLAIFICIASNVLFNKSKCANVFGRYIYLVDENNNTMGDDINNGTALLAKEAKDITIAANDIVLCYPADNPGTLTLRSISAIVDSESGSAYYTRDANHEDNTDSITKDKIAAVCTGYPESPELGALVRFALSIKGIVAMLLIPAIILVIFLIAKIVSKSDDDLDGEEFDFYEYDDHNSVPQEGTYPKTATAPLYEPSNDIAPRNDFERKKMSIAENFSQKAVNPDSPYQKERERTMQFKAQRAGATGTFSTSSAESQFAARNMGGQSSTAPTADALREEMLRKTAEAERTGSFSMKTTSVATTPVAPVEDNTGILSKAQLAEMSRDDVPKTTPLRSQSAPSTAAPRKSSSPDISDILSKSESLELKKTPSKMSVDDLLKMIEDEKKKL